MSAVGEDSPTLSFSTPVQWEKWLSAATESTPGVWLKLAKKGAQEQTLTYSEALEAALCFGWIDGQKAAYNEHFWLQRFTPRRPRSRWSKINREKATRLIDQGRMRPAGLREVKAAQGDGRWQAAYEGQRTAEVPEDLELALAANPKAAAFFATLKGANRYAILYRVGDAKRPQTRAQRIERYVEMLARGETIHG